MKYIKTLFIAMILSSCPLMAQKDFSKFSACPEIPVEDSDLKMNCSDYYSGQLAVRSGDTTYSVGFFNSVIDGFYLKNYGNHIITRGQYDTRTGESLHYEQPHMDVDLSILLSIVKEVFPDSEVQGANTIFQQNSKGTDTSIGLYLGIDPQTKRVLEMEIRIRHPKGDKATYAIPPRKIKELENSIKEKLTGSFPLPDENYFEETKYASYLVATARVFFKTFKL